jgi:hypothetical protein
MTEQLKIKRIPTTPIVDVFQGEGWENWTRLLFKNNTLIPLQGEVLSKEQLKTVHEQVQAEIKSLTKPKRVNYALDLSKT